MGNIFTTEDPARGNKRRATQRRSAPRPQHEGRRRFEFIVVSLRTSPEERRMLERDEAALLPRVKAAVKAGNVYDDFASSPQEPGRAVYMLRLPADGVKYPPVLMRVL